MQKTSLAQIATWCDGSLSEGSNPDLMLNLVVIDSRKATEHCLFVAVKGDNYDGHDFVLTIISNQITNAALVSNKRNLNIPNLIYVSDTILALGQIASKYRDQFTDIRIAAITGSHGKTTVKEMVHSICVLQFGEEHVLATEGNLNNHLGVPLMLLRLEAKHKVAIIEMGMNHAGEIAYLSKITKPYVAYVNNVYMAHAGFFKNLEDIAEAKGEVFYGLQTFGIACINIGAQQLSKSWFEFLQTRPDIKIFQYGADKPRVNHTSVSDEQIGSSCFIRYKNDNGKMSIRINNKINLILSLKVMGEHNQDNALGATVVAYNLGCAKVKITKGLNNYVGYERRLEQKVAFNGATLIDDSYNAAPASVKAAINSISKLPHPHWLVFADLKELGEFAITSHEEMAIFMQNAKIDMLLTVGELAKITHDKFIGDKLHFATNQDIIHYCKNNLPANATLLVKGSNSMNLNEVVNNLVSS